MLLDVLLITPFYKKGYLSMILKGNEDLRIKKTITSIHQAFIDMMLKTDYSKITVKSICDKAMINKKTFYCYYETLDYLLLEMQEIMMSEFLERVKAYKVPDELYKINEEFFRYSVSKGEVYEKIMCCESYSFVGKNISKNLVQSDWNSFLDGKSKEKINLLLCFLHNTGLELYRQWVYDGKKIPLEDVIKLSGALLTNGVYGFLKEL